MRVRVGGRSGAGRSTLTRALRAAGLVATGPDDPAAVTTDADSGVDLHVFVETLNADDRAALLAATRPTVAVLNKTDLLGFGGPGPLARARQRCRSLQRETGVPVVPVSALLAVAGTDPTVVDAAMMDALRTLAVDPAQVSVEARRRLSVELDLLGTACALSAIRAGAGRDAVVQTLCAVSGLPALWFAIEGADHLRSAVRWQRYARGSVSAPHRRYAMDRARRSLRLWAQAGGAPAAGRSPEQP